MVEVEDLEAMNIPSTVEDLHYGPGMDDFISPMPTIIGRLTGASFQTELLVMNLLGLVNSLRKWELGWRNQIDAVTSSERLGEIGKIILCWIVKLRIIIADIYTITYLANFYSILTWCRGRTLLPWIIISAFDNFLLEFIGFSITVLLWLEKSISTALFIEYMIARAIPRVPAFYYWCIINLFRADLRENERRKLTLASHSAQQGVSETSASADRIRFGAISHGKDYFEKLPRFASLTNLDDFSLHSSTLKYDDEQDYYKRSKSLVTFLSIDSNESDEADEFYILNIFDDDSLIPMEKAMKILKLNDEDINEARLRVTKNVFPNSSNVEKIDSIIFTVEPSIADIGSPSLGRGVSSIAPNNEIQDEMLEGITLNEETIPKTDSNLKNDNQFTVTSEKEEDNTAPMRSGSNDDIISQEVLKMHSKNPLSSCICKRGDKKSESDEKLEEFLNKNRAYEDDDDDSSRELNHSSTSSEETRKDETTVIDVSKFSTTSQSDHTGKAKRLPKLSATDELAVLPSILTNDLTYRQDPKGNNCEVFTAIDIALEPSECLQEENSRNIVNDSDECRRSENILQVSADDEFPALSPCTSKSTQTNISDCWDLGKPLEVAIGEKTPKVMKPHLSSSNIPNLPSTTNKTFRRFTKTMRTPENIKDREAREMRALKAYNKLTLLEDKRKMEAKKQKTGFSNRAQFDVPIGARGLTTPMMRNFHKLARPPTNKEMDCLKIRDELNQEQKRQTRSRSPEETSKLRAFRTNLDALQMAISLGFSSDNKTRFRSQKDHTFRQQQLQSSYPPLRTNQDVVKPSSKYSEPVQDYQNVSSQSTTEIEGIHEDGDHERAHIVKNVTGRDPTPMANGLENFFPRIIPPSPDNAEIQGNSYIETNVLGETFERQEKHGDASIREAIKSLNWTFDGRNSSDKMFVSRQENTNWNHANFLWDILDDTSTVTLLQSAFSSNPENASRGFYLNPGSTELYSVSSYLDDVIGEIMKTTRLSLCNDALRLQSTTEIDYGDCYLQEFAVTGPSTTVDSSEDAFSDSNTETDDIVLDAVAHFDTPDAVEMCWNSYSMEGLETRPNGRRDKKAIEDDNIAADEHIIWKANSIKYSSKNHHGKSIGDMLGEQELTHLDNWTRELKKLAYHDHRKDSLRIANCIQHLTNLPGFCVVKMVVDFFRSFRAVSRSTMTSEIHLTSSGTGTSTSPVMNQSFAGPQHTSDPSHLEVSPNTECSSQVPSSDAPRQDSPQPLKINTTCDSFDSLYSATGNSIHSDNVISIGGRSSMEEFSRNALNSTEAHR